MNAIFRAALELHEFCRARDWQFCLIGGLAVQRWGEPRGTQDVDATLWTDFGSEERFVDALLDHFPGRRPDARDFALRYRVVLVRAHNDVPLDIALGAMPFEQRAIARAGALLVAPGMALPVCSAEDLIVLKAFAGRERDWLDIESVILRQSRHLDVELIWRELTPLLELKDDPLAGDRLRRLLAEGTGRPAD